MDQSNNIINFFWIGRMRGWVEIGSNNASKTLGNPPVKKIASNKLKKPVAQNFVKIVSGWRVVPISANCGILRAMRGWVKKSDQIIPRKPFNK